MVRLIGLTGRARSGKNTVAAMIADLLVDQVVAEAAFADAVKVSAARALGVPFTGDDVGLAAVRRWADDLKLNQTIRVLGEDGDVRHEITGRSFLQRYGTEAHRELFDPDFWVKVVDFEPDGVDTLVMTDVRFPNEGEAIKERGGEVWRILRDGPSGDQHASERPLPDALIDREIVNRGTLDQLLAQVEVALGLVKLV